MDADERRISELERGFRREGLPNLIVGFSAAEVILTRATPFLIVVFVVEVVSTLDAGTSWMNLSLALVGTVLVMGALVLAGPDFSWHVR